MNAPKGLSVYYNAEDASRGEPHAFVETVFLGERKKTIVRADEAEEINAGERADDAAALNGRLSKRQMEGLAACEGQASEVYADREFCFELEGEAAIRRSLMEEQSVRRDTLRKRARAKQIRPAVPLRIRRAVRVLVAGRRHRSARPVARCNAPPGDDQPPPAEPPSSRLVRCAA